MARHIEARSRARAAGSRGRGGAAALLGINPHTLRARMRKLGRRLAPLPLAPGSGSSRACPAPNARAADRYGQRARRAPRAASSSGARGAAGRRGSSPRRRAAARTPDREAAVALGEGGGGRRRIGEPGGLERVALASRRAGGDARDRAARGGRGARRATRGSRRRRDRSARGRGRAAPRPHRLEEARARAARAGRPVPRAVRRSSATHEAVVCELTTSRRRARTGRRGRRSAVRYSGPVAASPWSRRMRAGRRGRAPAAESDCVRGRRSRAPRRRC